MKFRFTLLKERDGKWEIALLFAAEVPSASPNGVKKKQEKEGGSRRAGGEDWAGAKHSHPLF